MRQFRGCFGWTAPTLGARADIARTETLNVDSSHPASRDTPSDHPELDLRSLRCPLPVLRTRKHLGGMRPGATVRVLCTDPLADLDIQHLLQQTGDILLARSLAGPVQIFDIRKRP